MGACLIFALFAIPTVLFLLHPEVYALWYVGLIANDQSQRKRMLAEPNMSGTLWFYRGSLLSTILVGVPLVMFLNPLFSQQKTPSIVIAFGLFGSAALIGFLCRCQYMRSYQGSHVDEIQEDDLD